MCPVCHELVRRQAGTSKAAVAAIMSAGRIPLLLTDVEGAQQAKAAGQGCMTLFLAPVSAEVCSYACTANFGCTAGTQTLQARVAQACV